MNLIKDPGFESGEGWQFAFGAVRGLRDDARHGQYAAVFPRSGAAGVVGYTVPTIPTYRYAMAIWAKQIEPGRDVAITVFNPDSDNEEVLSFISSSQGTGEWQSLGGFFIARSTKATFIVQQSFGLGTGYWIADDAIALSEVDVVKRAKHVAFNAVIAALKTLRGEPTYWLDLDDRAYPALLSPEDGKAALPYACFPLIDEFTFIDDQGRGYAEVEWEGQIHVFVPDAASDPMRSTASEMAAKAHDDLVKLFKSDESLGGTVQEMRLVGGNTEAGILGGSRLYGEVLFRVRFLQRLEPALLGP